MQHLVDRRFNRARYDGETIVAGFTIQLREAVDLETMRDELLHAVERRRPARARIALDQTGDQLLQRLRPHECPVR